MGLPTIGSSGSGGTTISPTATSGTGAINFAPVSIGASAGGSSGISWTAILIAAAAAVAGWFFLRRKRS